MFAIVWEKKILILHRIHCQSSQRHLFTLTTQTRSIITPSIEKILSKTRKMLSHCFLLCGVFRFYSAFSLFYRPSIIINDDLFNFLIRSPLNSTILSLTFPSISTNTALLESTKEKNNRRHRVDGLLRCIEAHIKFLKMDETIIVKICTKYVFYVLAKIRNF